MLPSLSDKCGGRLQLVVPVPFQPPSAIVRRRALHELKKVDAIRVSYSGKGKYTVEVSTDSRGELTSTDSDQSAASTGSEDSIARDSGRSQTPVVRSERELLAFKELRDKVYDAVYTAHRGERCDFCTSIINWSVFGMNPDGMFLPLLGGERVARKLSEFLTDLVKCTVKNSSSDTRGCPGQTLVPQMVLDFLVATPASDAA